MRSEKNISADRIKPELITTFLVLNDITKGKDDVMKRIISALMVVVIAFGLTACNVGAQGNSGAASEQDAKLNEMSLEEILDSTMPETEFVSFNTEITEDTFKDNLFIDYIPNSEAIVSMPMMNAIPHVAVILRLPEGSDAASVAKSIEENADPRKWICVGAEKVVVKHRGNVILFVMSTQEIADAAAANFEAL